MKNIRSANKKNFRISKKYRLYLTIIIPLINGIFSWIGFFLFIKDQSDFVLSIIIICISAGIAGIFTFSLINAYKSIFIIKDDHLVYINIFRVKRLYFNDIKGFRITGGSISVYSKEKRYKKIIISKYYENIDTIYKFLTENFYNLDRKNFFKDKREIMRNKKFGSNKYQRLKNYNTAKKISLLLNGTAVLISTYAVVYPFPYKAIITILIIIPLLGIFFIHACNGLIRFEEDENSAYPGLTTAFLAPAIVLAFRGYSDWDLIINSNFLIIFSLGCLFLFLLMVILISGVKKPFINAVILAAFLLLYIFGFISQINNVFDTSFPISHKSEKFGNNSSYSL